MNENITITLLGASGHVGKSCFVVDVKGFRVLLDCGMQMNETSFKGLPDFHLIVNDNNEVENISAVLITHTHLDHCGSLPYLTEILNYKGPIYMSYPTKALFPLLMYNFIGVLSHQSQSQLSSESIANCIKQIIPMDMNQTIFLSPNCSITATIAGHILGAVMFTLNLYGHKIVYTGDFNLLEDHFLPRATIPLGSTPDLVLCESTYGNVNYKPKESREKELKDNILNTLKNHGKVIISEYPIGRAQELICIIEQVLKENNMDVPIYFNSSLAQSSLPFFKIFSRWTNKNTQNQSTLNSTSFSSFTKSNTKETTNKIQQNVKQNEKQNEKQNQGKSQLSNTTYSNSYLFPHLKKFPPQLLTQQCKESFILLASPPFFQNGISLNALQLWGIDNKNLIIIPGKCISGTVGNDLYNGKKNIIIEGKQYKIEATVLNISLSQHCDQTDLLHFINILKPDNIVFIHGDEKASKTLRKLLIQNHSYTSEHIYIPHDDDILVVKPSKLFYNCSLSLFDMERNHYYQYINNSYIQDISMNIDDNNNNPHKDSYISKETTSITTSISPLSTYTHSNSIEFNQLNEEQLKTNSIENDDTHKLNKETKNQPIDIDPSLSLSLSICDSSNYINDNTILENTSKRKYENSPMTLRCYSFKYENNNILTTTSPFYSKTMNSLFITEQYECTYKQFIEMKTNLFIDSYFNDDNDCEFIYNEIYFYCIHKESNKLYIQWNHTQTELINEIHMILDTYFKKNL